MELKTGLYIDGKWVTGDGTLNVIDPSTGEVIAAVSTAGDAECDAAITAAHNAFPEWAKTAPRYRAEILRKAFELMVAEADHLATLISRENGKVFSDARGEVMYAAEFFRWFSEEAVRTPGDFRKSPSGDKRILVTHQPIGVSLLITPWNFPAGMATRKIGPAIAAGCTMVLKPAGETPLTALAIVDILERAGVPKGVVNVILPSKTGPMISKMLHDPRVRNLSFTGSTEVGRVLLKECADLVIRTSMELGGNAPFVVLDDANIDEGLTEGAQLGASVSMKERNKIAELVDASVAAGAKVHTGGKTPDGAGAFYPPTVMTVDKSNPILQSEVFGPVAPIIRFDTDEEAIKLANDTPFGLISYVYSQDLTRAIRTAEALEAGMVAINRGMISDPAAPFGGVKQSGLGREGGFDGIHEYLETKFIGVEI